MNEVIMLLGLELFLHKCNWECNKQDGISLNMYQFSIYSSRVINELKVRILHVRSLTPTAGNWSYIQTDWCFHILLSRPLGEIKSEGDFITANACYITDEHIGFLKHLVWEGKPNFQLDLCWLKAHTWETDIGQFKVNWVKI